MRKFKRIKIILIQILIIALFLFGNKIKYHSSCSFQNEIYNTNYLYTKTDFTDFVIADEKPDIHSEVTPAEILIVHNDSYSSDSRQKFIIEYNIGKANFSNFDIKMDIYYDLGFLNLWGQLMVIIGSDYDADFISPPDRQLCVTQIKDPWWAKDRVFTVGAFQSIFIDEYEITDTNLATPDTVTFHLNRTEETVFCEILKDSNSIISHTWNESLNIVCNYIRIQLEYFSHVRKFSFALTNFDAILDILKEIDEVTTTTRQSISLPSVGSFAVIVTGSIISVISVLKRKNKKT